MKKEEQMTNLNNNIEDLINSKEYTPVDMDNFLKSCNRKEYYSTVVTLSEFLIKKYDDIDMTTELSKKSEKYEKKRALENKLDDLVSVLEMKLPLHLREYTNLNEKLISRNPVHVLKRVTKIAFGKITHLKNKKDALLLAELYIMIALELFNSPESEFACVSALTYACKIFAFAKSFASKEVSVKYFEMLAHLFLKRHMFCNFLNSIYRIHLLSKQRCSLSLFKMCEKIAKITAYKKDANFVFFAHLPIQSAEHVIDFLKKHTEKNSRKPSKFAFDFTFYDRIVFETPIKIYDTKFLSFLRMNNFVFTLKNKVLLIESNTSQSFALRIFNFMEEMRARQTKNILRAQEREAENEKMKEVMKKREEEKKVEEIAKAEAKKKNVVKRKPIVKKRVDYFRTGYNIFRMYSMAIKDIPDQTDDCFNKRMEQIKTEHDKERLEHAKYLNAISTNQELVDSLFTELDNKLKESKDMRKDINTSENTASAQIKGSWQRGKIPGVKEPEHYVPPRAQQTQTKRFEENNEKGIRRGARMTVNETERGFNRGSRVANYETEPPIVRDNVIAEQEKGVGFRRGSRIVGNEADNTISKDITPGDQRKGVGFRRGSRIADNEKESTFSKDSVIVDQEKTGTFRRGSKIADNAVGSTKGNDNTVEGQRGFGNFRRSDRIPVNEAEKIENKGDIITDKAVERGFRRGNKLNRSDENSENPVATSKSTAINSSTREIRNQGDKAHFKGENMQNYSGSYGRGEKMNYGGDKISSFERNTSEINVGRFRREDKQNLINSQESNLKSKNIINNRDGMRGSAVKLNVDGERLENGSKFYGSADSLEIGKNTRASNKFENNGVDGSENRRYYQGEYNSSNTNAGNNTNITNNDTNSTNMSSSRKAAHSLNNVESAVRKLHDITMNDKKESIDVKEPNIKPFDNMDLTNINLKDFLKHSQALLQPENKTELYNAANVRGRIVGSNSEQNYSGINNTKSGLFNDDPRFKRTEKIADESDKQEFIERGDRTNLNNTESRGFRRGGKLESNTSFNSNDKQNPEDRDRITLNNAESRGFRRGGRLESNASFNSNDKQNSEDRDRTTLNNTESRGYRRGGRLESNASYNSNDKQNYADSMLNKSQGNKISGRYTGNDNQAFDGNKNNGSQGFRRVNTGYSEANFNDTDKNNSQFYNAPRNFDRSRSYNKAEIETPNQENGIRISTRNIVAGKVEDQRSSASPRSDQENSTMERKIKRGSKLKEDKRM